MIMRAGCRQWNERIALGFAALWLMQATIADAAKADADTPLILLGSGEQDAVRELRRGDAIITSRMVYASMVVADEDITGIDGKVVDAKPRILLRKGAQLFEVAARSGNGKTYCAVDHKEVGPLDGVFVINRDKHSCFVDSDGDRKFDHSYDLRTKFSPFIPLYYDVETGGNALPVPISYSVINSEQCQLAMWLDIYVQSVAKAGRRVTVGVRMRTDQASTPFTLSKRIELTAGDREIELLGARIVLSFKGQDSVSAKVTNNIRRRDFTTDRPDIHYSVTVI